MTLYWGASLDLANLVHTHLFLICPNNSGSTFLKNVLATSSRTWNLTKEGQNTHGFAGPSSSRNGTHLLWAARQEWIDLFCNVQTYNWSRSRKAWYFQAFSHNPLATIFVTKSPPFLLNVAQLHQYFTNARFIFMVRNPYAVVESIYRRRNKQTVSQDMNILQAAAKHVMTCFHYQRNNIETYHDCGLFFTYETMCAQSERIEASMQALVPELDDLKLRQQIPVKGIYDEMLRDMNEQQIARLSSDQLNRINQVFEPHLDLLDYFGYSLRK